MFTKWQRKYEEEAARLVQVLRQWYQLESQARRLEWELARCRDPEAAHPPTPPEARKPALLRRAEAGKHVVPEKKRGVEQSWKNRHKEVHTFRSHYEVNAARLAKKVERLAAQLADCSASREKAAVAAGHKATAAGAGEKDPYARMPPAMQRMRARLEKVRRQDNPSPPEEPSPEAGVQAVQEKPHEQEKEHAPALPAEQDKVAVAEPPDEAPPPDASNSEAGQPLAGTDQTSQEEDQALERLRQQIEADLHRVTAQEQAKEEDLRAVRQAAQTLAQEQAAARQAFEIVHDLARHFRHGQRSFFDQPDAPEVASELASLIYYTLTHLALAITAGEAVRARAMYANLYTIARNLQTYKLVPLYGFDAALAVLRALPDGDAADYAAGLSRSSQAPGSEARPIREGLKIMRDKASVELRPFFYDVDQEGAVITIG